MATPSSFTGQYFDLESSFLQEIEKSVRIHGEPMKSRTLITVTAIHGFSVRVAGIFRVALIFAFGLIERPTAVQSAEVISTTKFHLSGHSRPATLEIVMTDGRFYNDEELWCGHGEKWDGQFEFRVRIGHRLLSKTPVNPFFSPKEPSLSMFFWSPKFKLVMHDYNRDGLMDFNLGQYRACIYNAYRIFTVTPQGRIRELPISDEDADDGVSLSWANHENSTRRIRVQHGLLTTSWYNREEGSDVVEQRAWKHHRFGLVQSKPVGYSADMEHGPKW